MRVYQRSGRIFAAFDGHEFPLFVGEDGHFYLHDPLMMLDYEHVALPLTSRRNVVEREAGLGADYLRAGLTTAIPAALAFVPVVGPILAPIAAIAAKLTGNMFGGTDPTGMSMSQLQDYTIQLRQAIFQLRTQLGIPDAMPQLPAGHRYSKDWPNQPIILEFYPQNIGITDPNHWRCGKEPGVSCPGCGGIRVCSHDLIAKMTPIYQGLQSQLHDKTLSAQIMASVGQPGVAPSTAPLSTTGSGVAPISSGGGDFGPTSAMFGPGGPQALQASMISDAVGMAPLLLAGVALIVAMSSREPRRASKRR